MLQDALEKALMQFNDNTEVEFYAKWKIIKLVSKIEELKIEKTKALIVLITMKIGWRCKHNMLMHPKEISKR